MKKIYKTLFILCSFMFFFTLTSCDMLGQLTMGTNTQEQGELDTAEQLQQIYQMAVRQGYTGTYEEWIGELKGDQVEFRVNGGFIQWKYSSSGSWVNLIPLSDIEGSDGKDGTDGTDGLTPYVGTNGNWWIGNEDTGIPAHGRGDKGEDGVDGLTPYIGENGNWWLGNKDTGVPANYKGEDGKDGSDGKSAYELFLEIYPEYQGDEAQWLDDLLNGRLTELNYKYHNVTFDDGCGNIEELTVLAKDILTQPEDPKKIGYIFIGWYADGVEWNFNANVVLKDIVLEAKWVRSSIQPTVYVQHTYADKTNVYFDIYTDSISKIEAIALYKGGELIETLDNLDVREFNNLLSSTEYRVEVTYSYDLNDGFGKQYQTTETYIYTQSKDHPSVYIENVQSTYNSISFDVNKYDYDHVAVFDRAELYLNDLLVQTITDENDLVFKDVLSGTNYTAKVYYKYDFNDGNMPQEYCNEFNVTTDILYKPVVTLNNIHSTQNTITAEVKVSDASNVDELVSVSLYKGEELIETGKELDLEYTGLITNTKYTIVVVHKYNINDGNGEVTETLTYEVATHPVYRLLNTAILNTSAILEGEMIFIHATVDNPSSAVFTKIYINDKAYSVEPSSTSKNVFAQISSSEIGSTEFVVNKLIAVLDGVEFEYYAEDKNIAVADVYAKMEVESIEFVNKDFEPIDYAFYSDEVYVKINLNNPEKYNLDSINLDGSYSNTYKLNENLFKIDDNAYYLKYEDNYSDWREIRLASFTYSNDLINKTDYNELKDYLMRLSNDDVNKISTIEELIAIGDNYDYNYNYYELTNDIDLSGIEWEGIKYLYGVFNGNGYSIKNMRVATTYNNADVKLGLFKKASGVITNTTIEDMIIMVELNNSYAYIGGLVGNAEYARVIVNNCHINKNSSISVKSKNASSAVGGLIGGSYYGSINESSNGANISVPHTPYALIGYCDNSFIISNSFNTGNLTNNKEFDYKETYICLKSSNENVINCYNTGAVNGKYDLTLEGINSISMGHKYPNQVLNWEEKTYSFNTNGGNDLEDINSIMIDKLPTPTKEGYMFGGWYDNEELKGSCYTDKYFSQENVTLYAKWLKIIDYSELAVNQEDNPFTEQNGVLISGNKEGVYYSRYNIIASKKIRVYFNYNSLGQNGYANVYKYSISGNGSSCDYDYSLGCYVVELNVGEKLGFETHSYNGKWENSMEIYNLVVVELE